MSEKADAALEVKLARLLAVVSRPRPVVPAHVVRRVFGSRTR